MFVSSNTRPARLEERAPAKRVACAAPHTCEPFITAATPTLTCHCFACPVTPTSTRAANSHAIQWSMWGRTGQQYRTENWPTMKGLQSLYQLFLLCYEGKHWSSKIRQWEGRIRYLKPHNQVQPTVYSGFTWLVSSSTVSLSVRTSPVPSPTLSALSRCLVSLWPRSQKKEQSVWSVTPSLSCRRDWTALMAARRWTHLLWFLLCQRIQDEMEVYTEICFVVDCISNVWQDECCFIQIIIL